MGERGPIPLRRRELEARASSRARSRRDPPPPTPNVGSPPPPPNHLGPRARELWAALAPGLHSLGRLAPEFLPSFEALCSAGARRLEAAAQLEAEGLTVTTPRGGRAPHPAVRIEATAARAFLESCRQFGLTPASAARLPGSPEEDADPLEDFRARAFLV